MKKILLLEDEEALGKIYTKRFDLSGYETRWVKTAEDAEDAIQHFDADFVLIDHAIRGREKAGLDIVPTLRKFAPQAKLIVLSNYDQFQLEQEGKGQQIYKYLLKIDYPPSRLVAFLEDAVN